MDSQKLAISASPLVSVIVPTYNRPDMLAEAIKSIRMQIYRPLEIVVVNDGGDRVEELLTSLNSEKCITYIRHPQNKGLSAARNTGIHMAKGKFIAYLDDDDHIYPDHLETLVTFLENTGHKVAYTDACRAHQEKRGNQYVVTRRDAPFSFDFDHDRILYQNFVPVLCFMHEKDCLDTVGLFDETLKRFEDWDMWIRMSRRFEMCHIKKITCEVTSREDGSTMTSSRKHEFRCACERIFEKYGDFVIEKPEIGKAQGVMRIALRGGEALELAREGNYSQAIALMEECLDFHCPHEQAHNILGKLYTIRRNGDKALSHFKKAVDLCGTNSAYRRDLEKALACFCPGKMIDPVNDCCSELDRLMELGGRLLKDGYMGEACHCFQKVIELDPLHLEAIYYLGLIAKRANQKESSLFFFKQALEINPSHVQSLNSIAACLRELDREEEARQYTQRAAFLSSVLPRH